MKRNEIVDRDQTKKLNSIKKYLIQFKESGVPFFLILNELDKKKEYVVGVVSLSLFAIIGILEIPAIAKIGLYILLIPFFILFYFDFHYYYYYYYYFFTLSLNNIQKNICILYRICLAQQKAHVIIVMKI